LIGIFKEWILPILMTVLALVIIIDFIKEWFE